MATNTAESAVRNYLLALKEPDSLLDSERINQIEAQLAQEDDVLNRVQLQEELRKAQRADAGDYEDEFVTHAKEWASTQGVSADAFIAEGVDRAVLRRAGMLSARGGGRGGGSRRAPSAGGARTRVSREDVEQAVTGRRKNQTFTIKDVQEQSGGSVATVRKVISDLIDNGTITEEGPDPDHSGPGRAPTLYKKA